MVEVIAGLNAVSNAANSHNSGCGGGEATSGRRRRICRPVSATDADSTRSADAPSFDDSVEYPVVGRDGILRACGVRGGEENRRAGDKAEGKKVDEDKKRVAVVHFSPDPDFTVTFER